MTFEVTDKILKDVENFASRGLTQEEIAHNLGIHFATLYRKKKSCRKFCEAIKKGKSKGNGFVKGKLFDLIGGGNVAAIIFYLKTQCGWKETAVNEFTGKDGGAIQTVNLAAEELNRKISLMLEDNKGD